jgi:hypothetical protein
MQSLSVFALAPVGQQLSLLAGVVIGGKRHTAWQVPALPTTLVVHETPSSQVAGVGHDPGPLAIAVSQVSDGGS